MGQIVYFLIAVIGVLFVLSVLLMLFVINLWVVNRFSDARWEQVKNKWQKKVYQIIMEEGTEAGISVPESDVLDFVDFLSELSRRLKGDSLQALARIAKPHLSKVARSIRSSNPDRRAWAARVLGTFGLPEYEKHLVAALKDDSLTVRMISFQRLILNGRAGTAESLLQSLPTFGQWNPNVLGGMLAQLGHPLIPILREKFKDPSVPASSKIVLAIALNRLNDTGTAQIAAEILKNPQSHDRDLHAACLRLLANVGGREHLPLVRSLCFSRDSTTRALAASALGKLGEDTDKKILLEAFQDPSAWVALHAARGLKSLSAIDDLHRLASQDHPRKDTAKQVLMEGGQ